MLKKLIKYDFKYLLRFWWIAALISFIISVAASGCIGMLENGRTLPWVIEIGATLLLALAIFAIFAFFGLTSILIFIRFYKNLFSDEGYLTFTLPVKTVSVLNSKLISAVGMNMLSLLVVFVDLMTMLTLGFGFDFLKEMSEAVSMAFDDVGLYLIVYLAEALLLVLAFFVCSVLFTYICISFASVITKKARVITAVGIYYAASSSLTFCVQMFFIFGTQSLSDWISNVPAESQEPIWVLVELVFILFFAMLGGLMYALERYILDRKLNLA